MLDVKIYNRVIEAVDDLKECEQFCCHSKQELLTEAIKNVVHYYGLHPSFVRFTYKEVKNNLSRAHWDREYKKAERAEKKSGVDYGSVPIPPDRQIWLDIKTKS